MTDRMVTIIALVAVFGVVALVGLITSLWLYLAFKVRQKKSGVPPRVAERKTGRLKIVMLVFGAVIVGVLIIIFVIPKLMTMPGGALEGPGDMKTISPESAI